MPDIHYQHPGTWFGDCMPLYARGAFQVFHQRDTRRPGPFGEPFGWALARTNDFVSYEDHGEVLFRGGDDEQDQFIFAGSVFEARGRFWAMYTGYNRDYSAQGRPAQVLMLAVSDDLVTWEKTGREVVPPQPGYDPDNWRDPFVLFDEQAGHWVMILGGRHDSDRIRTGRTVWLTSSDLDTWEFRGDFWAPDLYSMHEMPDLFKMGDWWYLLTTEYSDRSKTIYRMSRSLHGPWSAPVDDAFDGRTYYAARTASDGDHRYLFGWVPTKENDQDLGAQQWGGTLVVHEVLQRADGSLGVGSAPGVVARFDTQAPSDPDGPARSSGPVSELTVGRVDGTASAVLAEEPGPAWQLTAHLAITDGTRSVSLRFAEDESTGDAYAFTLRPGEGLITFDKVPNYPWFRYDARGHDRPYRPAGKDGRHDIRLIVDGDIATLYVDDVALNARFHDRHGSRTSFEVVDGATTVTDVSLKRWPGRTAESDVTT